MGNTDTARTPQRLSTYSNTPTLTPSVAPTHLSASAVPKKNAAVVRASYISTAPSVDSTDSNTSHDITKDLRALRLGLDRLEDKRLSSQRYIVTHTREEQMSALALGAKLERALGRRMTAQDAVFTPKVRRAVNVPEIKA